MRATTLYKTTAHEEGVWTLAWISGQDSPQLLTGSVDETCKQWQLSSDGVSMLHTFSGQTLGAISVDVEPTGTYAASSSLDSVIRVWSLVDCSTKCVIETPPSETWRIAFGPTSGETLTVAAAGGSTGAVTIHKGGEQDPTVVARMEVPTAGEGDSKPGERFVLGVAYNADYSRLAASTMDGSVAIFDAATGQLLHSLKGHAKPVRSLAFTPDGKTLVTGCDDMHANLYDAHSGSLVDSFSGHESWVLDVAMHPDGKLMATGSSDGRVKLWDLATRTCSQTLSEHTDQVWTVGFSRDGTRLASGSDDKQLVVYALA